MEQQQTVTTATTILYFHCVLKKYEPSNDQAIYCNKLTVQWGTCWNSHLFDGMLKKNTIQDWLIESSKVKQSKIYSQSNTEINLLKLSWSCTNVRNSLSFKH